MSKEYSEKEAAKILAKSMWKSVKKAIGKNPVQDVLDTNRVAEAKDKTIPVDRQSVMNKAPTEQDVSDKGPRVKPLKSKKLKGFMEKRKDKKNKSMSGDKKPQEL